MSLKKEISEVIDELERAEDAIDEAIEMMEYILNLMAEGWGLRDD